MIRLTKLKPNKQSIQLVYDFIKSQNKSYVLPWSSVEITRDSIHKTMRGGQLFSIKSIDTDVLVGIIGYRFKPKYFIPEFNSQHWIHYIIDERYAGKGIATQAVNLLLKKLVFTNIKTIYAGVNNMNIASIRVLERAGFKKVFETKNTIIFSTSFAS